MNKRQLHWWDRCVPPVQSADSPGEVSDLNLNFAGSHCRVLKVFLSRTAQRIPYMTSWRVLRLLAVILLIVCWFLVAWTSAVCQNADRKMALIDVGYTPEGLQFSTCLLDRWDYMMAVGELLPLPVPETIRDTLI